MKIVFRGIVAVVFLAFYFTAGYEVATVYKNVQKAGQASTTLEKVLTYNGEIPKNVVSLSDQRVFTFVAAGWPALVVVAVIPWTWHFISIGVQMGGNIAKFIGLV